MKTVRSCVLFFIGFTLFISCEKTDILDLEEHISGKTEIDKTDSIESADNNYFLELVYDKNYKYPDGFYYEKDLIGPVYYENTVSIKPVNERGEWIELHTQNKEEARNWSNLSNGYSSVNRALIQENETEKYFEFVRMKVNEDYPNDILLSRVHKSDYFIPQRNVYFLLDESKKSYKIGIFNGDLTISSVKELIEYLWDYRGRSDSGSKVSEAEISEQEDKFEYYLQNIKITGGDWGVQDMIYIYDIKFTLDKETRILSLTEQKLVKKITGLK